MSEDFKLGHYRKTRDSWPEPHFGDGRARGRAALGLDPSTSLRAGSRGRPRLCHNWSFVPLGLGGFPLPAHGLRRGLHSYAASRLLRVIPFHFFGGSWVATQTRSSPHELAHQLLPWWKLSWPAGSLIQ